MLYNEEKMFIVKLICIVYDPKKKVPLSPKLHLKNLRLTLSESHANFLVQSLFTREYILVLFGMTDEA